MSTTPTQTVTVDALNAPIAEKIVKNALQIAQRACANFVLDHLLDHANDPGATMPDLTVTQILGGAVAYETTVAGTVSTKGAGATYYDGRRRKSKRLEAKKLLLQCNVVKGSRRLRQRK